MQKLLRHVPLSTCPMCLAWKKLKVPAQCLPKGGKYLQSKPAWVHERKVISYYHILLSSLKGWSVIETSSYGSSGIIIPESVQKAC